MMKILLIEDHFLARLSQKVVLNDLYYECTIEEADSFEAGISAIQHSSFDLILLDIGIPGGNNKSMIERIREIRPGIVILMCSAADEQTHALEYIIAGANGYLSKSADKEEMITAIITVMKKNRYVSQAVQKRLLDTVSTDNITTTRLKLANGLSDREKEVVRMLLEGRWVKEIALDLNLRANTISTLKARIFKKMGVSNLIELAQKIRD